MKRERVEDFAINWSAESCAASPRTRWRIVEHCVSWGMHRQRALDLDRELCARYENDMQRSGHAGHVAAGRTTSGTTRVVSGAGAEHLAHARRLLYNLEINPLLRTVDTHDLANMTDADMRRGTGLEHIETDKMQQRAKFEAMLQETYASLGSEQSSLHCRRCKSRAITFEQKQTRGADEVRHLSPTCRPFHLPALATCHCLSVTASHGIFVCPFCHTGDDSVSYMCRMWRQLEDVIKKSLCGMSNSDTKCMC